jgi:hypothetical protein
MLDSTIISFSLRKDQGKIVEWYLCLFNWMVPGSKNTENWTATMVETVVICSLLKILVFKRTYPSIESPKYFYLPLLAAILGDEVEKSVISKQPRKVMFNGNEFEITEYQVKKGYRLFMPLFYCSKTPKVSVRSQSVKVVEVQFYLPEWSKLNRRLTDNDIINGALRVTQLVESI